MRSIFLFMIFLMLFGCKQSSKQTSYQTITGETMGTSYQIKVDVVDPAIIKAEVDSLLYKINQGVSTYEETSVITLFNQSFPEYLNIDRQKEEQYFLQNFKISQEIFEHSRGAFDPTIMPIVNYWGFGYKGRNKISKIDSLEIDSLMNYVGFEKLKLENDKIRKDNLSIELDFSAVAKGYGVDEVASFLESKGLKNYYVEIGGEVFAQGVNDTGNKWRTGISVPSATSKASEIQEILEVSGIGIATSGNYRNFYESNGEIYSHTINPRKGFPERSNLLSATILAPSCALADGYATACMVLGLEKSIEMINLQEKVEAILIYVDAEGRMLVHDTTKK